MLVCKHADGGDRLVPVESTERIQRQQQLFGVDYKPIIRCGAAPFSLRAVVPGCPAASCSPAIHLGPAAWGVGVRPRSRPCPALRRLCLLGLLSGGAEARGVPDVQRSGFGSVSVLVTCLAGCGLGEVEMVGKEGAADEAGGDGACSAVKL